MRPESLFPLFREVERLKGVGTAVAAQLAKLGISRTVDLLFHVPTGKLRRSQLNDLTDALPDQQIVMSADVIDYDDPPTPRHPLKVVMQDARGKSFQLIYFSNPSGYVQKLLPRGSTRLIAGKLDHYQNRWQITHPDYVVRPEQAAQIPLTEPIYPLTEGISGKRLRGLLTQVFSDVPELPEWIDAPLLAQKKWPSWRTALARRHEMNDDISTGEEAATFRLAYDEFFAGQLALALLRQRARAQGGRKLSGGVRDIELDAPFELTGAQQRCVKEIIQDMQQTAPMLRLLQGDVGSGKTIVALLAAVQAARSGVQTAILAPTEILARQHLVTFNKIAAPCGLRGILLTGREKGKIREAVVQQIADGSVDVIIGTHALFQDSVTYHDLGFVVIDEQHKFGVHQRLLMTRKSEIPPHMLVMTATPIPRTMALTAFGELDMSRLDERPPGRQPIDTRVMPLDRLEDVYAGVARQLKAGAQIYWVCPLVEESEKVDLAAAQARAANLHQYFGDAVALVHGKLKPAEKDAAMARFSSGEASILVATTVIEVGVDVPNATVMIIEQAERFGLAQLHQLRGRVGRGSDKSVCLLLWGNPLSETSRARLQIMRDTDDGFIIAEEDFRLRGSGDLLGARQSGLPDFKLADPALHGNLLPIARDDARSLLSRDPELSTPRGQAARMALYVFERDLAAELLRSG
jgi:ATP-dependent DNA helicase RecG